MSGTLFSLNWFKSLALGFVPLLPLFDYYNRTSVCALQAGKLFVRELGNLHFFLCTSDSLHLLPSDYNTIPLLL